MRRAGSEFDAEFWVLDGIDALVFGPRRPIIAPKLPPRRSELDDWLALAHDMNKVSSDFQAAVRRELARVGR